MLKLAGRSMGLVVLCGLGACELQPSLLPPAASEPLVAGPGCVGGETLRRGGLEIACWDCSPRVKTEIEYIHNTDILKWVVTNPDIDRCLLLIAMRRTMHVMGPTAFLKDMRAHFEKHPEQVGSMLHQWCVQLSAERIVWVDDAVFIRESSMSRSEARNLLNAMKHEVEAGTPLEFVWDGRSAKESDSIDEHTRSSIARVGPRLVHVSDLDPLPFPYSIQSLPERHVRRLLTAKPGDLMQVEHETTDGAKQFWLYSVKGVHQPSVEFEAR